MRPSHPAAFAAVVLLLAAVTASAQDVVILRNGNEFEGRIVEDREGTLVVLVNEPVGKVALGYENLYSVNGIPADRILGIRAEIQEFLTRSLRRRGLTPVGSFPKQFFSPKNMIESLRAIWVSRTSKEEFAAEQRVLEKLQLMPTFVSLTELLRDAFADPQPSYYDARNRVLFLSVALSARPSQEERSEKAVTRPQFSSPAERLLLFHELQHLLQDHNYLSVREIDDLAPSGDQRLAIQLLQEGDADLALLDFLAESEKLDPGLFPDVAGPLQFVPHTSAERLQALPGYLADLRTAPHAAGLAFARRAYQAGGWGLIGRVFADLPTTTEQVLHAEKYFVTREEPLRFGDVGLADLNPGATVIWSDVWGELRIRLLLGRWLGTEEKAQSAAAGWDGDRMFALQRDTGQIVLAWRTAWDEERDAQEFFAAVQEMGRKRHGERLRALPESTKTLAISEIVTEDGLWQEQCSVELRGKEVVVLESSHLASAEAMREALWSATAERARTGARVQLAAGELPEVRTDEASRGFWNGPGLTPAAMGFALEDKLATVTGGKASFSVEEGWSVRPDGALTWAVPGNAAVVTAESFTLPFAASSSVIGMWHEGRLPAQGTNRAARRVIKTYPAWTAKAGGTEAAYIAAESATDPELKVLARIYRVYLVNGTEGLVIELRFPEDQLETFGPEAERIFSTLRGQ